MEKRYQNELTAFGQKVKNIRLEKGLTQLDLEIATGITEGDISRIENGKKNIEFITIVKLAVALEVNLSEFFWLVCSVTNRM